MNKIIPFRLKPGQDLKKSCFAFLVEQSLKSGAIISAVGSLRQACLRLAGAKETITLTGPFEITSLSGTLSLDGVHLHISLSDRKGQMIGGHLMDGCLIETTAEIVVVLMEDYVFTRTQDPETGYKELRINSPSQ